MTSPRPLLHHHLSKQQQKQQQEQHQQQQHPLLPAHHQTGTDYSMPTNSPLSASLLVPASSTPWADAAPTPLPSLPQPSTATATTTTTTTWAVLSPADEPLHVSSTLATTTSSRPSQRASRLTSRQGPHSRLARTHQLPVARPLRRNRPFHSQTPSDLYGVWDMPIRYDRWPSTSSVAEPGACTKGRIGGGAGGKRGGVTSVSPGPGASIGASGHIPGVHLRYDGSSSSGDGGNGTGSGSGNSGDGNGSSNGSRPASGATVAPLEASNSTASWTVGVQPRYGKSTDDLSSGYNNNNKAHVQELHAAPTFSSRSSFLRALGKFKNKHLQQRRPATSRVQMNTASTHPFEARPPSFVLPPIHLNKADVDVDSTTSSSTPQPHDGLQQDDNVLHTDTSRTASLAFAPARPEAERMPSHASLATIGQDTISTFDDRPAKSSLRLKLKNRMSHTLASIKSSSNLKEKARQQQQQQQQPSVQHHTSMATTTNPPVAAGRSSTASDDTTTASGSTSLSKSPEKSLRHSRSFWSFPRVRLGDGSSGSRATLDRHQSLDQPVPTALASALANLPDTSPGVSSPPPTTMVDEDVLMLSPEQRPTSEQQLDDDGFDSDDSMDIITPLDYSDYTLYAELPLKKRKKLEAAAKRSSLAALAASSSGMASSHRPQSMRASADAMKRFLQLQRQSGLRGRAGLSGTKKRVSIPSADAYEPVGATISQDSSSSLVNENKKRGKRPSAGKMVVDTQDEDDDSLDDDVAEPSEAAAPNSTVTATKRHDGHPPEWRHSLLRSLPFGRNMKKDQVIKIKPRPTGSSNPSASGANTTTTTSSPPLDDQETMVVLASREMRPVAGTPMGPPSLGRVMRTNSVHSRSQSFASSTHPALMATSGMMVPRPRGPGVRRETLEMAMRRRRQSSAARSRYSDAGLPSPADGANSTDLFNVDNSSNANVTHTFTSFTLELIDMHHAHDVMNKSVVPGLFNFKQRQHRLTISSITDRPPQQQAMEMDQDFRGFDSDAVSGYAGDADVSMESIMFEARSIPPALGSSEGPSSQEAGSSHSNSMGTSPVSKLDREKDKSARPFGFGGVMARRKIPNVEGESDTITDLPVLSIRTRDLGSGSGKQGRLSRPPSNSHSTIGEDDSSRPRSPNKKRMTGSASTVGSPTLSRKTSRGLLRGSVTSLHGARKEDAKSTKMGNSYDNDDDGVLKWEELQEAVDHPSSPKARPESGLKPLVIPRGSSGDSNTSTLVPSSGGKTPHSGVSSIAPALSLSPSSSSATPNSAASRVVGRGIPSPLDYQHHHHHQPQQAPQHVRQQSSLHEQQGSSSQDAPLSAISPQHLKNFSTASTLSASSGYSAQTLTPGLHHYPSSSLAHSFMPDRSTSIATSATSALAARTLTTSTSASNAITDGATPSPAAAAAAGPPGAVEFDPSADFPPATPSDLKAMDFETLLLAAEREQQKGWEELKASKKLLKSIQEHQQPRSGSGVVVASHGSKHVRKSSRGNNNNHNDADNDSHNHNHNHDDDDEDDDDDDENRYRALYHPKSALSAAVAASHQTSPLRMSTSMSASGGSSASPLRPVYGQRQGSGHGPFLGSTSFDFDSSGVSDSGIGGSGGGLGGRGGYGSAASAGSVGSGVGGPGRTKRVMKQKKSVIRLAGQGSVQGRREDDGVIRVSKSMVGSPAMMATQHHHGRS
ncbi:hypothetical protein DFQ26_008682 [Actinomortierella ambigua]|nr:hypothetical protein DFQ26_008682 [Actinomortierella ambigua]